MALSAPMYLGTHGIDASFKNPGTKTAAYTAVFGEVIPVNTTGGAVTITLPPADRRGEISVRLLAGAYPITVDGDGTETIDGATTTTITMIGESRIFVSQGDGTWVTVAGNPVAGIVSALGGTYVTYVGGVNTVAASGAAQTIPEPYAAQYNDITLTAACTLTLPAATVGKRIRFVFRQDGTGSRVVTWPAGTIIPGGALGLSTAASSVDAVEAWSVATGVWMVNLVAKAYA